MHVHRLQALHLLVAWNNYNLWCILSESSGRTQCHQIGFKTIMLHKLKLSRFNKCKVASFFIFIDFEALLFDYIRKFSNLPFIDFVVSAINK